MQLEQKKQSSGAARKTNTALLPGLSVICKEVRSIRSMDLLLLWLPKPSYENWKRI